MRKVKVKDQVKSFTAALTVGDFGKAETDLRQVVRRLDKVAAKGTIHKNTAARKRSRLARLRGGAAKAAGGPYVPPRGPDRGNSNSRL